MLHEFVTLWLKVWCTIYALKRDKFQAAEVKVLFVARLSSPQTGGEGSASVPVQEVDGKAFEGVSIWHGSPHGILELLVAAGGARAALQLIGGQRRGQQVAKVVVPHGGQLQVLQGRQSRSVVIAF